MFLPNHLRLLLGFLGAAVIATALYCLLLPISVLDGQSLGSIVIAAIKSDWTNAFYYCIPIFIIAAGGISLLTLTFSAKANVRSEIGSLEEEAVRLQDNEPQTAAIMLMAAVLYYRVRGNPEMAASLHRRHSAFIRGVRNMASASSHRHGRRAKKPQTATPVDESEGRLSANQVIQ